MKIVKLLSMILCVFLLFFCLASAVYAEGDEVVEEASEAAVEEVEENETIEWLKGTLLPTIIAALFAYFTYRITNIPFARSNNTLATQLISITKSVADNKTITDENVKQLLSLILQAQVQMQASADDMAKYDDELKSLQTIVVVLAEAVRVGLCNNPDLVKKGTAEAICKLFEQIDLAKLLPEVNHEQDAA